MLITSLVQGAAVLGAVAVLYWVVLRMGLEEPRARAVAFAAIVFGNIALILSNRSQRRSLFSTLSTPNLSLWVVAASATVGLLLALYVPALQNLFHFVPLSPWQLSASLAAVVVALAWFEMFKLWRRHRPSHQVRS
jgi:Ca2+-transporting ATPase